MALTEKMKVFAREYYKNGGNGTEAYLIAYDTENRVTASRECHELLKRADILEYIRALNIPQENKAISERERKRAVLWEIIENGDNSDKCRALDILNKMDSEYININRNIEEKPAEIVQLDTNTLKKLSGTA